MARSRPAPGGLCGHARGSSGQCLHHGLAEQGHSVDLNRGQRGLPVTIGRGVADPGGPLDIAEHDGVGSPPRANSTVLQQCFAQIAVVVSRRRHVVKSVTRRILTRAGRCDLDAKTRCTGVDA